jgi:hypothetical protein
MKIIITTFILLISLTGFNQEEKKAFESFGNNAHIFSGGIGLASYYLLNSKNISETTPSFNIKYEYGGSEEFGFGLNFAYYEATLNESYQTKKYDIHSHSYTTDTSYSNYYETWSLILRLNYHPIITNKVDVYLGEA